MEIGRKALIGVIVVCMLALGYLNVQSFRSKQQHDHFMLTAKRLEDKSAERAINDNRMKSWTDCYEEMQVTWVCNSLVADAQELLHEDIRLAKEISELTELLVAKQQD